MSEATNTLLAIIAGLLIVIALVAVTSLGRELQKPDAWEAGAYSRCVERVGGVGAAECQALLD